MGRKVLVIHPGAMGDLIQALPAFERLRSYTGCDELALLVGRPFASLARAWQLFDSIIDFEPAIAYHGGPLARGALFGSLVHRLRRERFSAAVVFKASTAYAALAFLSRAHARVGLARGFGRHLLHVPLTIDPDENREDRFLRVAMALGACEPATRFARWPIDQSARAMLANATSRVLIGVAPGGARNVKEEMPERRWPTERYAELSARLLAAHAEAHVVVLGGKADQEEATRLAERLPATRVTNLAGKTSIFAARDIISECQLFVTHDSGLLHVASTTATPVVAIFGPTAPHVVCNRGSKVSAVWHPAGPRPCHDEVTGRLSPCDSPCCIERCSVDEVFERSCIALASTRETVSPSA